MYPIIRLINVMIQARKAPKIAYTSPSTIQFRCHPWDLDMFNEMNNGRVLTLYDLGRFNLGVRCNLLKVLGENKWALVVAGSSVRYRKRIKMFDKITMHTQCVGIDEKWFYIEQSMWVKDKPCSSVLIRGGISSKNGLINPAEVLKLMGDEPGNCELSEWVQEWIESEQHRPWPPTLEAS
ncbi:acyl-CoA thioesterase [Leucothrix pacifica]|uniref:Thioeseterase n=1 Tax=Leucothrix pacifica TaxID=1247513 RepID=A0A317CMR7_9GAMM|nr:acyl-CoA thioesterase [Leucothrix pacifica]PWQ99511.1 thioeseterase [Leucothrix pacifica]